MSRHLVSAKTQRQAILDRLVEARGAWVALPEIVRFAAQYGARIFELRRMGFRIENRVQDMDNGRHSWFRLVTGVDVKATAASKTPRTECAANGDGGLAYAREAVFLRKPSTRAKLQRQDAVQDQVDRSLPLWGEL